MADIVVSPQQWYTSTTPIYDVPKAHRNYCLVNILNVFGDCGLKCFTVFEAETSKLDPTGCLKMTILYFIMARK